MDLCVASVYSSTRWNDVCLQHWYNSFSTEWFTLLHFYEWLYHVVVHLLHDFSMVGCIMVHMFMQWTWRLVVMSCRTSDLCLSSTYCSWICITGRHAVWELGASSRPTAGTSGGLTRHTRRAIWAMSGRNPSLVHPMPRALFWRRCKQMLQLYFFSWTICF